MINNGPDTVCVLIFTGLNICGFHGSTAIHKNFVHKNFDILLKGSAGESDDIIDMTTWRQVVNRQPIRHW